MPATRESSCNTRIVLACEAVPVAIPGQLNHSKAGMIAIFAAKTAVFDQPFGRMAVSSAW
jgi:hypothetical protein